MTTLDVIPRPVAVKWLIGIAWLRPAVASFGAVLAVAFLTLPEGEWAQGFRRGWIERAGFDPVSYGPEQAGATIGGAFMPALLAALTLLFARRRHLIALRIVAGLLLLFALTAPLGLPLAVTGLVLTFRASTVEYCRRGPGATDDAA